MILGLESVLGLIESHGLGWQGVVEMVLVDQLRKIHSLSGTIEEGNNIGVLDVGDDAQHLLDWEEEV